MKVAIVYDRVNKFGGAEKVLLALHELFPDAPLFTSVYNEKTSTWAKVFPNIITSFLQFFPFAKTNHESLATFMPLAFEGFNFNGYDLVVSVSSEAAKGIITRPGTKHISICLTPTRYLWSHYDFYFKNNFLKTISLPFVGYLRRWDKMASKRPDKTVAISRAVQKRIMKYYGLETEVVFPPVETERFMKFKNLARPEEIKDAFGDRDYYLFLSRLVPYKKVDIALKAFAKNGKNLVIAGSGREEKKYRGLFEKYKNIFFAGFVKDTDIPAFYANAKAFIFPGEEDFGIVMVEAVASGIPVIAARSGGALDIIREGYNGLFFDKDSVKDLVKKIREFETKKFDRRKLILSSDKFTKEVFKREIMDIINNFG